MKIGTTSVDEAKSAADWVKESVLDPAGLGDVPVAVEETVYWVSAAYLL